MELQFDNEIDAILRKARGDTGAGVIDANHLDADVISAFVENALPDRSRAFYIKHFADCTRCRKLLSQNILMRDMAAPASVGAAGAVADGASIAPVPWYGRLFRSPNPALATGVLVLVFGGILGILVLQDRNSQNVTVSQIADKERMSGVANLSREAPAAANAAPSNSASAANTAADSTNAATDRPLQEQPASKPTPGPSADSDESTLDRPAGKPESDKETAKPTEPTGSGSGQMKAAAPAAASPPPAADKKETTEVTDGTVAGEKQQENKDDRGSNDALAKRKTAEDRRDESQPASKNSATRSGPRQNQSNQVNSQLSDMPATRVVGGKTFDNKNGAWYDRAYHGQATQNYRRGTEDYKKLDKGLRSVADTIGGTVVMVWKDTAYRIQ